MTNCAPSIIRWLLFLPYKIKQKLSLHLETNKQDLFAFFYNFGGTKSFIFRLRPLYVEIWINLFFNNGVSCCSIKLNKNWLNYRIQGHLFTSHWIKKVPIVLCFVLQKILTHVKRVVRSGPAFSSCSFLWKMTPSKYSPVCFINRLLKTDKRTCGFANAKRNKFFYSFLQIIIKLLSTNHYTNIFKNWLTLFNNAHGNC